MVSAPVRVDGAADRSAALSWSEDLGEWTWRLLCCFVLTIPFSIFVAQLLLVATSCAAVADWRKNGRPRLRTPIDLPVACFLIAGLVAAFFGLDWTKSLWGLRVYLQIFIVYVVFATVRDVEQALVLVGFFLAGLAIAGGYTVLAALSPWPLPRLFLGHMTQSGQLIFAIAFSLALLLGGRVRSRATLAALALYVLALIANLKRGVWLGVLATVMTTGALASRRLVIVAGLIVALLVSTLPPVRARIENSARDFFLPGNRYDIWLSAVDVVKRFPMGVGYKNGAILRDYPNIPAHHKHAHNNLLQVTLESGALGLATFLWWMGAFARLSWQACRELAPAGSVAHSLAVAVFASFVGFHVAGLVEYNFGDSEVLEIFFVTMGLGLRLHADRSAI